MSESTNELLLLIIEDSDDHTELAEFYISDYSERFRIERLCDGAEALAYFEKLENSSELSLPWLVLLDLKLPKYDGHEILTQIKGSDRLSPIPVVIFSTSNSEKDVSRALRNCANSYIVKPMEADQYGEVISGILRYWELNQHQLTQNTKENDS
ncbi:MAG: response regulator [Candidatus Electrothrix aestuarii]|jgi:CheY-like chemotaxis protein|uniref:Response regulator n=1 Tax=Candidatus Electrothrix aestuarii TaxID=3062594 RepID=A0AAU8LW42_9BACT|nr:response regulator [Candidatus Electrothrix aestuarii]